MWSPLGDEPLPASPSWRPEPQGRGHYGIISTCVLTLSLCVWSALHLNVPEHKKSGFSQTMTKIKWLFVGLVAPEIIAFVAFRQRVDQRRITVAMKKALGEETATSSVDLDTGEKKHTRWRKILRYRPFKSASRRSPGHQDTESSPRETLPRFENGRTRDGSVSSEPPCCTNIPPSRQNPWSTTHSFLALMGGFAIDTSLRVAQVPLPHGRTRLVLTPKGLVALAECRPDLIPDVSAEQIRDKSKTNSFAKSLMIVQAMYFCLHFISRPFFGLSVTLLELNTFAHTVCALAIYFLWWDKPLDIQEPVLIPVEDEAADSICAAMFLASTVGQTVSVTVDTKHSACGPFAEQSHTPPTQPPRAKDVREYLAKKIFRKASLSVRITYAGEFNTDRPFDNSGISHARTDHPYRIYITRRHTDDGRGFGIDGGPLCGIRLLDMFSAYHLYVTISKDMLILRRASLFSSRGRSILNGTKHSEDRLKPPHGSSNFVVGHQRNWSSIFIQIIDSRWQLSIITMLYGGWHLLAWNGPFPSYYQQVLWRLASIGVGTTFLGVAIMIAAYMLFPFHPYQQNDFTRRSAPDYTNERLIDMELVYDLIRVVSGLLFFTILALLPLLLVFSRCYLVVGSILALPYSPDSAFQTPNWSLYFPHAS